MILGFCAFGIGNKDVTKKYYFWDDTGPSPLKKMKKRFLRVREALKLNIEID